MKYARLELDFVAAPHRPLWLGLLLLLVGLGIAADLALRLRDARAGFEQVVATQGSRSAARSGPAEPPLQRNEEEAKAVASALRQLTLPWAMLIQVLEDATSPDVALLQVEPLAQQRLLRITAQARNFKAMLNYQNKLALAPSLENVHLLHHQVQNDDPQKPLQFTLQATFKVAP